MGRPSNWVTNRNSGFRISWHYKPPPSADIEPDSRFVEDNKLFIRLANIVQEAKGVSEDLKHVVDYIFTHCTTTEQIIQRTEQKIMEKFGNISTEPIYVDEITDESLEIANSITFGIYFCSSEVELLKFYQGLFENFSLETVLKVLARIISVTKEKKLVQYYDTAKKLLDNLSKMMNLRNKHIAVRTTAVSELDLLPDLRNYHNDLFNKEIGDGFGFSDIEGMINHPVHVSDEVTISAFIPFCSFGDAADRVGKWFKGFNFPVCSLFRETIVDGQVCYEADINQFKDNVNWVEALNRGFGFIVDTNKEYDVKSFYGSLGVSPETTEKTKKSFDVSKRPETEKTFRILLKTISN